MGKIQPACNCCSDYFLLVLGCVLFGSFQKTACFIKLNLKVFHKEIGGHLTRKALDILALDEPNIMPIYDFNNLNIMND